jgi:hypothetical protein
MATVRLKSLDIEPLSVPGRYLAFSASPPAVLNIDSAVVVIVRLLDNFPDLDEARKRAVEYFGGRGVSVRRSGQVFDDAIQVLRDAGILEG